MPFWRKSEKSDARRDAEALFLLVKGNTEKSSFTKKCCGEKKSVFRHHWPFYPIRLRDFYIFSTEFSSYTRHGGSLGGGYGLPCKFCEKCFKPEKYAHLHLHGLGGSGSQVWPNRAILWGSKAACPGMVLAPFWTDFGRLKPRLWPNFENYENYDFYKFI